MYIAKREGNETGKYFHSLGLLNFLLHVLLFSSIWFLCMCAWMFTYVCSHMYVQTHKHLRVCVCVREKAGGWWLEISSIIFCLSYLKPSLNQTRNCSPATTSLASTLALVIPCLHFLDTGIIGWPQCPPSRHRCSWNLNSGQVLMPAVYTAKTLTAETAS